MSDDSVSVSVGSKFSIYAKAGSDDHIAAESLSAAVDQLLHKASHLVDAVSHDNNGSMVAGRYVGGNGGLYSTETIKTADALRLELDRWK